MVALKIDDLCDFLAVRGLPCWMVGQMKRSLTDENNAENGQDGSPAGSIAPPLTKDALVRMGIAHPLHQRRVLREFQCLLMTKESEGAGDASVSKAPGAIAKPRKRAPLVLEQDMRWPFLDIPCLRPRSAEKPKMSYGHAQRRLLRARPPESATSILTSPTPVRQTSPEASDVNMDDLWAEIPEDWEAARREQQDTSWEEWLNNRLHSWGMLSLVDEVLKAACLGNLSQLQELLERVQEHGEEFEESLAKTPLPAHVRTAFPEAPPDAKPPSNIWDWISWRRELLESADSRLAYILCKANDLVDSVVGVSTPLRSEPSLRPSHSRSAEKRKTLNVKRLMQAAASGNTPDLRSSGTIVFDTASTVIKQKDAANPEALARFRKAAQLVLSYIRAKRQDGLVLNTKLLTCISSQAKVTQTRSDLLQMADDIDKWPHLVSENRKSCEVALGRLQQASNVLFSRFVELRQHVEVELRETTNGDQGIVDCWQLESKIIDMQRELASQVLLGHRALQDAHQSGLSLRAQGIAEPPNPWEGMTLNQPEPPWEASFLRALRKLEPLKRNLQMRRQGTAVVSTNSRRSKSKKAMKAGTSAPEEMLMRLLG